MLIRKAAIINRDQIKQNSQGKANRKKEGDRVVFITNKALISCTFNLNIPKWEDSLKTYLTNFQL